MDKLKIILISYCRTDLDPSNQAIDGTQMLLHYLKIIPIAISARTLVISPVSRTFNTL